MGKLTNSADKRSIVVGTRFSAEEFTRVNALAEAAGARSVSDYVRDASLRAAKVTTDERLANIERMLIGAGMGVEPRG